MSSSHFSGGAELRKCTSASGTQVLVERVHVETEISLHAGSTTAPPDGGSAQSVGGGGAALRVFHAGSSGRPSARRIVAASESERRGPDCKRAFSALRAHCEMKFTIAAEASSAADGAGLSTHRVRLTLPELNSLHAELKKIESIVSTYL